MGNVWSLEGDTVSVLPAQSPDSPVAVEAPGSVVALAPDFNGMVWCSTGGRELFRLNPRGPGAISPSFLLTFCSPFLARSHFLLAFWPQQQQATLTTG